MLGTRHRAPPVTSAVVRRLHVSSGGPHDLRDRIRVPHVRCLTFDLHRAGTRRGRPSQPPSHGLMRRHKPWRGESLLQQLGRPVKQLLGLVPERTLPERYLWETQWAAGQQQGVQRSRKKRELLSSDFRRQHKPWSRSLLQQLCKTGEQLLALQQRLPAWSVLRAEAGAGLQKALSQAFVWLRADMSPAWIAAELSRSPAQPAALPAPTASSGQGAEEGSGSTPSSRQPGRGAGAAAAQPSSSSSSGGGGGDIGGGDIGGARSLLNRLLSRPGGGSGKRPALSRAFLEAYQPWALSAEEQDRVDEKLAQVATWVDKVEEAYGPVIIRGRRYSEGMEMSSDCEWVLENVWKGSFFADVLPLLPGGDEEDGPDWIHWLPCGPEDYWSESRSRAMELGSRHFIREVYKCHSGCSSAFVAPLDVVCFPDLLREEAIIFTPEGGW